MPLCSPIKLPRPYHDRRCYWAQMLTFRCTSSCPFCILNMRGRRRRASELSGGEVLAFWNRVEHRKGQSLSLIGGEPTLHADLAEIVRGLKGYEVTVTTNCRSPFFDDPRFAEALQPGPNSRLRINTTFHPNHIAPEEYLRVVQRFRQSAHFVDQTSYVHHPSVRRHGNAFDRIREELPVRAAPYLGFYDSSANFQAPFDPANLMPNEDYHDPGAAAAICGLTDLGAYRDICGQREGRVVTCDHPMLSLIIGPSGNYYHCHYKLYYDIDPVCNVREFVPVGAASSICRHYGFCNPCDVPRVGCAPNGTSSRLLLNKLYDKRERRRPEISHLFADIQSFARRHGLECNELKWFEYAYCLLYSGHRYRGAVLDVGSARSVFPSYLAAKGYDVTTLDVADLEHRAEQARKHGGVALSGDIRTHDTELDARFDLVSCLSVIEHIDADTASIRNLARYVKPGGVMVISTDFYERHIPYPHANRTLVTDRPAGTLTDSRVYTPATFGRRIIAPLEGAGLARLGSTDFGNVDLREPSERAVRGLYTFGVACLRRPSR